MYARILCIALTVSTLVLGFDHSYTRYDGFLSSYVCGGGVAYDKIRSDPSVDKLKQEFAVLTRGEYLKLPGKDRVAYLVNMYNFYTIVLILDNLPLKTGIRDIGKPWDIKFVPLFGEKVSLNHIEHELLRKEFDEPRIHFALVCASGGCPALSNKPFTGTKLDAQLDAAARGFLADRAKNRVEGKKVLVSKIFEWYGGDFKERYGGYQNYVKAVLALKGSYAFGFLSYDWTLNKVNSCK